KWKNTDQRLQSIATKVSNFVRPAATKQTVVPPIKFRPRRGGAGRKPMKNERDQPMMLSKPPSVGRRGFLQSAAGAALAVAGMKAAPPARNITSQTSIRLGLIGRDGHYEILLSS